MQITVKDAAALMGVAEKTIYRWIQAGGLPAYRVAGRYRLRRGLLMEWAQSHKLNFTPAAAPEDVAGDRLPTLAEALAAGGVFYRVSGRDPGSAVRAALEFPRLPETVDRELLYQAVMARENLQSTSVGGGVAIPHARNPLVLELDKPLVSLCFLERAVDFRALDGRPVTALFLLLAPTVRLHLHLLSRLTFVLQQPEVRRALQPPADRDTILARVRTAEARCAARRRRRPPP